MLSEENNQDLSEMMEAMKKQNSQALQKEVDGMEMLLRQKKEEQ